MVKTLLGLLLMLCGLGIPAWSLPASDSPGMTNVAQDSAGTVWALPTDSSTGALRRRQAQTWVTQTIPDAAGFRPRVLTRGENGSVYAFWQKPSQWSSQLPPCLVTVHHDTDARTLAHFSGLIVRDEWFPNVPTVAAGPDGDVWIMGCKPLLWHISRDGSVTEVPLQSDWALGGKWQDAVPSAPLATLLDGQGRRWFWQGGLHAAWQQGGLRGVLIWNGKTLDHHATLTGVPDRSISVLAPLDADHLWLAVDGDGYSQRGITHGALYRVDTRTLTAVPVTPPELGAFQNIVQIFRANGDWYAVEQTQYGFMTALWRSRNGRWRQCLEHLDRYGGYAETDSQHPWLAEPSGIWFGVGGGAWWLPHSDQPAVWVDWRRGIAADSINGLFPSKDGAILAVGLRSKTQMPPTPQPIRPLPPNLVTGGMGAPPYMGPLMADARYHLWGKPTSYTSPCPLDEWDGRHWTIHLPPKTLTGVTGLYACDTLGRIWLTTSHWNPPAQPQPIEGRAVYDPAHDTWTDYATVPDALQAAAKLPGMGFLPYRLTYQPPAFSGDGRVTYAQNSSNGDVFLYDGQTWRHWAAKDILPSYPYGNLPDSPRFNSDGHLEVVLNSEIWDWTPDAGWQRAGVRPPERYVYPVPPDGPRGLEGLPVTDRFGTKWFTWQGAVYTAWHGLWAKQNELSAPGSPFRAGYGLEDVLRDTSGRIFFVTRPAVGYDLVVWSPPPVSKPRLTLIPTADDAVTVRVRTQQHGRHWWLWRLNSGAWSAPLTTDTLPLTTLPHGDYRLEVQTLDAHLQPSTPAVAVFSIRVAPAVQITRWVQALQNGTEAEREAAVAGLVKQPDAALPALRAVPSDISESGHWWVEAAIQQIEAQKP